jgi:hypothetical protein
VTTRAPDGTLILQVGEGTVALGRQFSQRLFVVVL